MITVVGIDLGTSNSSICFYNKNGNLEIIKDGHSHNISSIIAFTKYGCVFGNKAKIIKDNNIFISNIKRLIGYKYKDLSHDYYNQFSCDIIDNNGEIGIVHNAINETKIYSPNELMMYFLNYLKTLIEYEILTDYKVIVTVPAYFNIQQKEAISNCVINVGFDLIKLLSEPTSASIAYGNFINYKDENNILIFDLGGGTLDLSIINILIDEDDPEKSYEVVATYGNNKFGGSDLTFKLMNYIKTKYYEYNLSNNNLFDYIDRLKIKLNSGLEQETIYIDDQEISITNNEFKPIVKEWLENIDFNLNKVLEIANLNKQQIDHVLLVGGTSKIKQVREKLESYFDKKIGQYYINKTDISLEEISVAYGSAYHGNILYTTKDMLLIDVCPFSIGIETSDGLMVPIINTNSKIPIRRTKQFTTQEDNTTEVKIKIFQGESNFTKNNIYLGEFILNNIPKAKKGVPVINVSIEINNNGLLRVTAKDRKQNTSNEITISAKDYKLNELDIERIKSKMIKNRESENILFNLIEKYNVFLLNFDKFIYSFIISPVIEVHDDFKNTVIYDIQNRVLEIYFAIKLEAFDDFISFDKFFKLVHILFDNNIPTDYIVKDFTKDHQSILIHLKNLFEKFNKYLLDTYSNLLIDMNNNTMEEQTYDKTNNTCDITDLGFSKTDGIIDFNKKLLKSAFMSELGDINADPIMVEYNIKLYEYNELVQGLMDNLEFIPITIVGKNLLINFIGDDQDELQDKLTDNNLLNVKLLIESINKINSYCQELSQKYYYERIIEIETTELTAKERLDLEKE